MYFTVHTNNHTYSKPEQVPYIVYLSTSDNLAAVPTGITTSRIYGIS